MDSTILNDTSNVANVGMIFMFTMLAFFLGIYLIICGFPKFSFKFKRTIKSTDILLSDLLYEVAGIAQEYEQNYFYVSASMSAGYTVKLHAYINGFDKCEGDSIEEVCKKLRVSNNICKPVHKDSSKVITVDEPKRKLTAVTKVTPVPVRTDTKPQMYVEVVIPQP